MVDSIRLVVSLGITLLVGALGGIATARSVQAWYPTLIKPWFTPPSWLFGPVWTTLYILMGISLFLIWRHGLDQKWVVASLVFFGIQLVLNVLWSFFFFGLRSPLLGLVDISLLLVALGVTIALFSRVSGLSAWLLVPYFLWTVLAAALNFSIWRLNG